MATNSARGLARERKNWLLERARAELGQLRQAIATARARRKAALLATRKTCARARAEAGARARAFRKAELERINREAAIIRNAARNRCQARRHIIRASGAKLIQQRRAEVAEQKRMQRQIDRAGARVLKQKRQLTSKRERAQEDDDAVRSNLPQELLGVFDRVRKHIKGGPRTTRTEAFLEWAESHPEDVLEYQGHDTDREVARLIAEHEAASRTMRKTRGAAKRKRAAGDSEVPF
jgi:hypothetical protein